MEKFQVLKVGKFDTLFQEEHAGGSTESEG